MLFGKQTTSDIGKSAENLAAEYLAKQGLNVIDRNFSAKTGEIDLIAMDSKTLVFVEVKFRKNSLFGQPYETVTHSKQQKIIRTAQTYLQKNKKYSNKACRFDIISILNNDITWLKHAFE
ncbi:MAG: YraN family protein [Gammaproteobacteria bacterium]|nr:YraN family protein [Gammaproteobacteria bacterium]